MKIVKNAAIAALLSCSVLSSPAYAEQAPWGPPATNGMTALEVCAAQLRPDPNSDFIPHVVDSVAVVVNGPDIRDATPWQTVPTGTPTANGIIYNGVYYRNGGSPNVWGGGTANSLTYPSSDLYYHTHHTVTTTTTFGCQPSKRDDSTNPVEPFGLSSSGNVISSVVENVAGDDYIDHNGPPVTEGGQAIVALICISPNNVTKAKPGTWTAKHGFAGSCTDASNLAGGLPVPSNNAPTSDAGIVYFPH